MTEHKVSQWKWLEVAAVIVLLEVGAIAGALTGIVIMGPIMAVVLPLIACTIFLRSEGKSWTDLGITKRLPINTFFIYLGATLVITWLATNFLVTPVMTLLGAPPVNIEPLRLLIEDDLTNYLLFVIPVAWGSAAIGEEMLTRGFLLHRISTLSNDAVAVILQAVIFASAHFYQGWMGVANIFALALIFGVVYIRCGRSLLPLIIAHGLIDTVSITLLYLGHADWLTGAG